MSPAATYAAATVPDWISAISSAVLAIGVLVAALGWTLRQAKQLSDPGEAPPGEETREIIEDVARDQVGDRVYRKDARKLVKDKQKGQSRKVRWQRFLRRIIRRHQARKRERETGRSQSRELPFTTHTEDRTGSEGD